MLHEAQLLKLKLGQTPGLRYWPDLTRPKSLTRGPGSNCATNKQTGYTVSYDSVCWQMDSVNTSSNSSIRSRRGGRLRLARFNSAVSRTRTAHHARRLAWKMKDSDWKLAGMGRKWKREERDGGGGLCNSSVVMDFSTSSAVEVIKVQRSDTKITTEYILRPNQLSTFDSTPWRRNVTLTSFQSKRVNTR